jgi:hypothetical protein
MKLRQQRVHGKLFVDFVKPLRHSDWSGGEAGSTKSDKDEAPCLALGFLSSKEEISTKSDKDEGETQHV